MHRRMPLKRLAAYLYLCVTSLLILYPLLFMFLGPFVTLEQYRRMKVLPIPTHFSLEHYIAILQGWLWQSLGITLARVLWYITLALAVSLFGGYVFSRLTFPGKRGLFLLFLSGLMVPDILISLPTYVMLARWPLAGGNNLIGLGGHGLVDQWPSLFILGLVDAFALFLIKQSYDALPTAYEEAATVDGAGLLAIILRIYVPLHKPALTAVTVITFVRVWNDYFYPFLLVSGNPDLIPIALAMQRLIYSLATRGGVAMAPYPAIFAQATLMCLPPILLYLGMQRYFVQGLNGIGLKGS